MNPLVLCLSAERREDAGDHQVHSSVPAEVLHREPGEPESAAQEPQPLPQPGGKMPLKVTRQSAEDTLVTLSVQFITLVF